MNKAEWIERFKRAPVVDKNRRVLELCAQRRVLDVGCVGQDKGPESDDWLHNRLRAVASEIVGVDIVRPEIERLQKLGLNIVHLDDLPRQDSSFDVVVMGDVIEHVNDPVGFLQTYRTFLRPGGHILVTTPNPFYFLQMLRLMAGVSISVNPEHTCWLDPITFLEVADRAELPLADFYWCSEYDDGHHLSTRLRWARSFARLLYGWRHQGAPNFLVVLENP